MEKKRLEYNGKARDIENKGIKMRRRAMFDDNKTSKTLMNGIQLNFEKAFGFCQNKQIKSGAYCIDDNRIIYILASQIVLYDLLAESQRVIATFNQEEQIGAMIYFKNIMLEDNVVYAIHNPNKSFPSLIIHNFTKKLNQVFMLATLQKDEKIIEITLFNDFRNIAIISVLDKIIRLTIVETVTKEIKQSQFLPFRPKCMLQVAQFPTKLIFQGPHQIYVLDTENEIKFIPLSIKKHLEKEDEKIVQIATSLNLELTIYGITDQGNLFFFTVDLKENKIVKSEKLSLGTFKTLNEEGKQIEVNKRPSSICANEYNILIGYQLLEEFTLVKIFAISTQMPTLETIRFSCPYLHEIVRMNFAAETMAICVIVQVKQNDKYDFSVPIDSSFFKERNEEKIIKQNIHNHKLKEGKIFPVIFNLLLYDTLIETLRSPVQTILNPLLFTKKIIDMCVLPTKKLILILSADKNLKALKYENVSSVGFQKMLAWQMIFNQNDQITSFDVHPLVFTVAVGFREGIKLFSMFLDGIKPTNIQFPLKNCECVKYSKFGHLLVAGSSSQIVLINPYQNRIISSIQLGYGFNIKEISFIDQDMYLFSSFTNGNNQIMNLEGNKLFQVWNKNMKCIASAYDPVFDIMILSYDSNEVKFWRERDKMDFATLWTFPFLITKILVVNQLGTLFMGTSTGKLRAYQWPFTSQSELKQSFTEIQLHTSAVNQIKIGHDYSYLISGSDDGSVFISKISAYSQGIQVSDSSMLHTFKSNKKNSTSLYYLQNFICTNSSRQAQKQQEIIQYELDKVDFETDQNYILQNLKQEIDQKLVIEETNKKETFKQQISPYQEQIESMNVKKLQIKEEISKLLKDEQKQIYDQEEKKLNQMRKLYKESDDNKAKLEFYHRLYQEETQKQKLNYQNQYQREYLHLKEMEDNLMKDCAELEKDLEESKLNYRQLMKEQEEEGIAYKKKMMQTLEAQLSQSKHRGEDLRKIMNKNNHDIQTICDQSKFLIDHTKELQIDIKNNIAKKQSLDQQKLALKNILLEKDQQIFDQQKAVKELLKKSINNYSHEEYLKHKQDELINKAKYLEQEIANLDEKYSNFQQNFIEASKENNDNLSKVEAAEKAIKRLKDQLSTVNQTNYLKKYKYKQLYTQILNEFHACHSKKVLNSKIIEILQQAESQNPKNSIEDQLKEELQDQSSQIKSNINKRDHKIDQVLNNNKLRKIDDTIRRTIMIKLNRQTVNLTSQVNELRKEKKKLSIMSRDLYKQITSLQKQLHIKKVSNNKENQSSITEIVPENIDISVIRSQNSKYTNAQNSLNHSKPLPFQIYHANKYTSSRNSQHSYKNNTKSLCEENSTQLPSIIKSNNHGINNSYSGSALEQTNLMGVEEIDDEIGI